MRKGKRRVRIPFRTPEAREVFSHQPPELACEFHHFCHAGPNPLLGKTGSVPTIIFLGNHENIVISFKIRRKHMNFQVKENGIIYRINTPIFIPWIIKNIYIYFMKHGAHKGKSAWASWRLASVYILLHIQLQVRNDIPDQSLLWFAIWTGSLWFADNCIYLKQLPF